MSFDALTNNKAFSIGLFIVFIITSFLVLRGLQTRILFECVQGVGSDIVEYSNFHTLVKNSPDWYVLTRDEADRVITQAPNEDCGSFFSRPQDMVDKKLEIAVKSSRDSFYQVTVWSKGFDNISGTEDDIVFGERPK